MHAPVPSRRGGVTDESWAAVERMVDPKEDRPRDAPPHVPSSLISCHHVLVGLQYLSLVLQVYSVNNPAETTTPFPADRLIFGYRFIVGIDVSRGADQDGLVGVVEKSYRSFISFTVCQFHNLAGSDSAGPPAQSIEHDHIA